VISPDKNSVYSNGQRNRNILEIMLFGLMMWQYFRNYGKRNYSELAIQRYKLILFNTLQARELVRQKKESRIGCGLGTPKSYHVA
jgi:hypothetical protein